MSNTGKSTMYQSVYCLAMSSNKCFRGKKHINTGLTNYENMTAKKHRIGY